MEVADSRSFTAIQHCITCILPDVKAYSADLRNKQRQYKYCMISIGNSFIPRCLFRCI